VKFSELWRLTSKVYKEVSFQSIFSLRSGSALPRSGRRDIKKIVASARVNTLISKLITAFFIGVFAAVVFLPVTMSSVVPAVSRERAVLGSVSAFLSVVLFLIVFMGLQMSTSFVSSKIVDVLSPLPLSRSDISRIVFLCFIRIFDIPLVAAVAVFLPIYFLIGGSALGGMISVLGILVTEIYGLALTIVLARFFYSKVASAGGRSMWQSFLRFAFMLVWILPTFAAYFVMSFATEIVQSFASLMQGLSSLSQVLVLLYPFSYGFLVSGVTFLGGVDYTLLGLSIGASLVYVGIAYYCLKWVTRTVRKMGVATTTRGLGEAVKDTMITPQVPWLGIIRKDLRVASRSPSYASLFFLPVIQTAILALSFSSFSELALASTLGILIGISMITLLLPPTLLSIEGLASAYTRHLPMRKLTMIAAKAFLSTFTYLISLVVLSIVAIFMGRNFSLILIFGAVHGFSVAAAVMLELSILTRKFWREGFAVGNIYSRMSTYIVTVIPGYVLAGIPIVGAFAASFFSSPLVLPVFVALAVAEFVIMTAVVALEK
jgi:hypothetical protein